MFSKSLREISISTVSFWFEITFSFPEKFKFEHDKFSSSIPLLGVSIIFFFKEKLREREMNSWYVDGMGPGKDSRIGVLLTERY